ELFEPLTRHCVEVAGRLCCKLRLFRFALGAWIDSVREQLTCLIAPLSRLLQSDLRVGAERNQLFSGLKPVLQSPPPAASRHDQQIEAAAVEKLAWSLSRFCVANSDVGQRHSG